MLSVSIVPSSPPRELTGVNSSSSSLLITWSPPIQEDQNGIIQGYNISYFAAPNGSVTDMSTSETTINITGLLFYTQYNVSVAAYTSVGTGPSDSTVVRTDSSG